MKKPTQNTPGWPDQRMWDLLRQMRGHLSDENLISQEEYAQLAMMGAECPRRLESYDESRARAEQAEATVGKLTTHNERLRDTLAISSTDEEKRLRSALEDAEATVAALRSALGKFFGEADAAGRHRDPADCANLLYAAVEKLRAALAAALPPPQETAE